MKASHLRTTEEVVQAINAACPSNASTSAIQVATHSESRSVSLSGQNHPRRAGVVSVHVARSRTMDRSTVYCWNKIETQDRALRGTPHPITVERDVEPPRRMR
jgi:hypothetical protein